MTESWVIYGLRAPGDDRIRYVGFTRAPAKRLRQHIRDAAGKNRPVHVWIRSLLAEGIDPEIIELESGQGAGWRAAECRWIAHFGLERLLNVSPGGNMPVVSPDARQRAGSKMRGVPKTPEHRAKVEAKKLGRKRPDVSERMRRTAHLRVGVKMNLTDDERARRRESLGRVGNWRERPDAPEINAAIAEKNRAKTRSIWASMTPEERAARCAAISAGRRRAHGK